MDMIPHVSHVITMIEKNAHELGLTDKVKGYLLDIG